jgi:hypothetical protein
MFKKKFRLIKYFVFTMITIAVITSCNGQPGGGRKQAQQVKNAITEILPGTMPAQDGSWTMTATINGKNWTATSVMPPEAAGRIIGYYEKEYIGLPYSKTDMIAGKKITINEDNAVDLSMNGGCLYTNPQGTIEITKADEQAAEGKFFFSNICMSTKKETVVTDGFFRILFTKN